MSQEAVTELVRQALEEDKEAVALAPPNPSGEPDLLRRDTALSMVMHAASFGEPNVGTGAVYRVACLHTYFNYLLYT